MRTPSGHRISHADHGASEAHCRLIDTELEDWDGSFTIRVVALPGDVAPLMCGLYGPAEGDEPVLENEVTYRRRGDREGLSRMCDRLPRPIMSMVIIAGPRVGGEPPRVYTVYGGSIAVPREPWDDSLSPEEKAEAVTFWSVHALSSRS